MAGGDLRERVRAAYAEFQSKATREQVGRVEAMLREGHSQALGVAGGDEGAWLKHQELAHAWSAITEQEEGGPAVAFRAGGLAARATLRPDGGILGLGKYELLDPGWLEAAIEWSAHFFDHAKLGTDPAIVPMKSTVTIAMAGDWGAEPSWGPSQRVAKHIGARGPDYTIHLGDVY